MKKVFALALCLLLLAQGILPASAAALSTAEPAGTLLYRQEIVLENGLTLIDEVYEYAQGRSTDKIGRRTLTICNSDNVVLGIISFEAVFRYDGSTVSVVSKTVTQTDTYEGYSYKQNSFTSSGGTVTLAGKLTKLLIFNHSFTMSLTCDVNGNLSY